MAKRSPNLQPRASTIRRILDRGGSRKTAMHLTGATRQAVHAADKQRRPRGRPPVALPRDRVTMYVKQVTGLRLSEAASERGQTVGEVVDALSDQLRKLGQWGACKLCGNAMLVQPPDELLAELERILTEMLTQEVSDRTRADYHASAALTARMGLAYLLDRVNGHCLTCGPWRQLALDTIAPLPPSLADSMPSARHDVTTVRRHDVG